MLDLVNMLIASAPCGSSAPMHEVHGPVCALHESQPAGQHVECEVCTIKHQQQ